MHAPAETTDANCIRCGLCLSVCPTYREHLSETASPRGRVILARKGLEGQLRLTPNLIEQMYSCMACMACTEICPVGVRPAELALWMRQVQERAQPRAWKGPLFAGLIPHPGRMEWATLPLRLYQGLGVRRLTAALGLTRLLPGKLRDLEAMLPRLPARPLRQVLPLQTESRTEPRYRVGFFLGCAQSLLFAEESAAAVRVLARNGCTVIAPREVVCCGMPAAGYGRMDLVRDQARRNIAAFEPFTLDAIVTDCATCGSTLRGYASLLSGDDEWAGRAGAFSASVRDISEFLADIPLQRPRGRLRIRATYHDPCHLRRGQGVWEQPRSLLASIDGLELVELPEADWCCGSAGSQLITHYDTSLGIMRRKIDNLAATGAAVVASGCPGCQMQLQAGIRRRRLPVRVAHPVTLLDEAYGGTRG
jgi:glycolate oxidase iron-sulfur subunit